MDGSCRKTVSTLTKKNDRKRRRKYGVSGEETALEERMSKCVPNDVMEAMADLSPEKKHSLYLDIFKPLDFYELLFQKNFKQN